mmetsp:Transcript_55800/g.157198  ORF Transcript_55800/g.157198 Transcript_55800/m.157198 type:complete len:222 (-) Transcript_55800:930-1595(-)
MRASRSARACVSHAVSAAACILSRTAVQQPSGGPASVMTPASSLMKPAMPISSSPASPATLKSFALSAAFVSFSCLNLGSSGFCSTLSRIFRPVRKKGSCTSHASCLTRASAASAASSSIGNGAGSSLFDTGVGASWAAMAAGAAAGGAVGRAVSATPQHRRHAAMSKLLRTTSPLPSAEICCPVWASRTTRFGMPRTPNAAETIIACCWLNGTASHGISL